MTPTLQQHLINALDASGVQTTPWTYGYLPRALPEDLTASLCASFDRFDLKPCVGRHNRKSYKFSTAALGPDGPCPTVEWEALIDAVLDERYRAAVGQRMAVDLSEATTTLGLWEYRSGDWLAPHLDKEEKLVTQIIYLTDSWKARDGGRLLILKSDNAESAITALSPVCGSSAILVRSEESWHAVEPPRPGAEPRRSVTVTFWR